MLSGVTNQNLNLEIEAALPVACGRPLTFLHHFQLPNALVRLLHEADEVTQINRNLTQKLSLNSC